jgi:two-component system, OmpR family, response regulator
MPLRILIVEDEVDFREGLCEILELEGFHTHGVGSFASYRAWRSSNSCDLMILDRNLPDGDGLEILKMHRRTDDTPAIFLSGAGQVEDRIQGMNADADYYLVKPVNIDELLAIIRRFGRKLSDTGLGDAWIIDPMRSQLTSPDGIKTLLTKSELAIMSCFIEKAGLTVRRDELIETLGGDPTSYDPRRLEIAIRRLRRKLEDSGITRFPLSAVYGKGFSFNGPISSL